LGGRAGVRSGTAGSTGGAGVSVPLPLLLGDRVHWGRARPNGQEPSPACLPQRLHPCPPLAACTCHRDLRCQRLRLPPLETPHGPIRLLITSHIGHPCLCDDGRVTRAWKGKNWQSPSNLAGQEEWSPRRRGCSGLKSRAGVCVLAVPAQAGVRRSGSQASEWRRSAVGGRAGRGRTVPWARAVSCLGGAIVGT